jgi:Spherulation-specific family 4
MKLLIAHNITRATVSGLAGAWPSGFDDQGWIPAAIEEKGSMIRVVCVCGRVFKAEDRHAGRRTRCPACGASLVIGPTPAADSGADLDGSPSGWYPTDPTAVIGAESRPAPPHCDSESMPTAIIEPAVVPAQEQRAVGGDMRASAPGLARRLWTVTGAVAASLLLAFGLLYWIHVAVPGRGRAMASRAQPGVPSPRDAGRGAGPRSPKDRVTSHSLLDGRVSGPPRRLRLLVPAYIYPGGEGHAQWQRLVDAAGKVDLVVVVNPDSGPGVERDPAYASAIVEAARSGVALVGYVNTGFGNRPIAQVKEDIDNWFRLYPRIGGVFLDQQAADSRHATHFAEIGAHARGKIRDALVIGNPGTPCDESYLARRVADVVCIFSKAEGFEPFEPPATLKEYDPSHLAALAYQVADAAAMRAMLKEAIVKRIGYIYITDGKWPNPWGQLPAYWDAEVEAMARLQ